MINFGYFLLKTLHFPQFSIKISDPGVRESDGVSVETPLVTSEDGRSSSNSEEVRGRGSSNSEEAKYNKTNSIKYDDRESQV